MDFLDVLCWGEDLPSASPTFLNSVFWKRLSALAAAGGGSTQAPHLHAGNPQGTLGECVFSGIQLLLTEPAADSGSVGSCVFLFSREKETASAAEQHLECRNQCVQNGHNMYLYACYCVIC